MTWRPRWSLPPPNPGLEPGEVAVWQLRANTIRPIENILARYLGRKSAPPVLTRSPAGKPEVAGSPFAVSLADSGDVVLVAVARGTEIGVDVEASRTGIEEWALPAHALTEGEQARLEAVPIPERSEAFLSIWTRKEALLKAVGTGLAVDPRLIELEHRRVVAAPPEFGAGHSWTLVDVPLPGYAAALALRGPLAKLLLYDARGTQPSDRLG